MDYNMEMVPALSSERILELGTNVIKFIEMLGDETLEEEIIIRESVAIVSEFVRDMNKDPMKTQIYNDGITAISCIDWEAMQAINSPSIIPIRHNGNTIVAVLLGSHLELFWFIVNDEEKSSYYILPKKALEMEKEYLSYQ